MYLNGIALFLAIYGHSALAALPDSCEAGDITCTSCTPRNSEFEPPGVGEVWYSECCTESETSTADPPVTTTKKYCYSYKLVGYPSNQFSGTKPSCGAASLAWSLNGQCSTTAGSDPYTVLTDDSNGCPGAWDSSTTYEIDDTVEDNGVVYKCSGSPQYCSLYGPDLRGVGVSFWVPTASCTGTATPTQAPAFSAANMQEGCPEEFDSSNTYEANDSVSVKRDDGTSILYRCKPFPESQWCNVDTYSPLNTEKGCNGNVCWPQAWIKQGACEGTFTPTATPTFDPAVGGCPEVYEDSAEYEAGDKVTISGEEGYGKIYQCKSWPNSGYCGDETYSPANTDKGCNGAVCWPTAWTYVSGCSGTITPTGSPVFTTIEKWDKDGCPDEYVANNPNYQAGSVVSISINDDNTYGIVWKCKEARTAPWCQQEGYAPGTQYGGQAWERVGHCEGTMSPTTAPVPLATACQFKYNLETTDGGEYVILPVESWEKGGSTVSTGGTALDLSPYKPGQLVRYGGDARKCKGHPYTGYCAGWSPFIQDSPDFNPIHSPQGWEEANCEQVGASAIHTNDEYEASDDGPVFDSNGKVLVNKAGDCQTGVSDDAVVANNSEATNPEDYFKASPAVKGCQKCDSNKGLDSTSTPKVCTSCQAGAEDEIVDRKSVCVCTNGASNPWDTVADHCKSCPSGKKYLGSDTSNASGDATCETCPSGFVYTTRKNSLHDEYKLCCTVSGCEDDDGLVSLAECYDGTTAKTHCQATGLTA
mmetsp:Transcript_30675/g.48076  ORF Transcript_30675/g.48076 Transcript_30675/m.48076 type:complete len:758 (-) Transcript_30675:229-2502(-)